MEDAVVRNEARPVQRRRVAVLAFALVIGGCRSPDPTVRADPAVAAAHSNGKTLAPPPELPPELPTNATDLRVLFDPPMLRIGGHELTVRMKTDALKRVLGKPTKSTDYGAGEGAMSNTTYLSYADRGLSIRTKNGKVEAFYVYFVAFELDGVSFAGATPTLPKDVPLDASIADVVDALGKPTKRTSIASMEWTDLEYVRQGARFEFHFDHDVFRSVSLEIDDL